MSDSNPQEGLPEDLAQFVREAKWTFAKTYAQTWPHHYIVRRNVDERLFLRLVAHIRDRGYTGRFYSRRITYFEQDGFVYWTMVPPPESPEWYPVDREEIVNRCGQNETYESRLKAGTLPRQGTASSRTLPGWAAFDNWAPPPDRPTAIPDWAAIDTWTPFYSRLVHADRAEVQELLHRWDTILEEFGRDPTHRNWANFRPLRVSREEDWSDWLAFLLEQSSTGILAHALFGLPGRSPTEYKLPRRVHREVGSQKHRADLVVEWQSGSYSHLEVKVGDESLEKTAVTGEALQRHFHAGQDIWSNHILLLPSQLVSWEAVSNKGRVRVSTWENVCVALRRCLALAREDTAWRVWAYSITGAAEQLLVRCTGYTKEQGQVRESAKKVAILSRGLQND